MESQEAFLEKAIKEKLVEIKPKGSVPGSVVISKDVSKSALCSIM